VKFDLQTPAELRIHAYDTGAITLAVPRGLELELAVDPETGLCQVTESLILTSRRIITDWEPNHLEELTATHLEMVLSLDPELVLLGTGARQQFPAMELLSRFHRAQIGVEVMDTAAACRTFNILIAEGRHVAAALLMI
jgi:uncharacterized protein